MADINNPMIAALAPLVARVRTDRTAAKTKAGRQFWTHEPLTAESLAKHLNGGPARGVCPIREGESVTLVALLDFDSHKGEVPWDVMAATAARVVDVLEMAWGCTPLAFRSSGGRGIHVVVIWDDPQDARSVRVWLADVLDSVGLAVGTRGVRAAEVEVFPKQDHVPVGGLGNQFILPGSGASEWLQVCELSGMLVSAERGLTAGDWAASPGVPLAAPVERAERTVEGLGGGESLDLLWAALDAIPNGLNGSESLGYDDWRDVVYGVHAACGGSDEGLARAEEWSARSPKYVPGYCEEKIWNYAARDRVGGITGATVLWKARAHGWRNPAHGRLDPSMFEVVEVDDAGDASEVGDGLKRDKHGAVEPTLTNTLAAVRHADWIGTRVAWDEFIDEGMVARPGTDDWRRMNDADLVRVRVALEGMRFKSAPKETTRDAVMLVAEENKFDSAVLWLEGIEKRIGWDGTPRVAMFLRDFFGCADTPYTRAVSYYIWTALAGRVLDGGCQADMVPILEGDQGLRKTSALAAMSPSLEAFCEVDFGKDDDELARLMRGVLVCEVSELRGLNTRDQESIKAFVTRRREKWTPKYKEFSTSYPRRCVMFGTTNQQDILGDETGNRRWLPVHVERADVEGIKKWRDQLWCEGAAAWRAEGVAWEAAERLAVAEHQKYRSMDEWETSIREWLGEPDAFEELSGMPQGESRGAGLFKLSDVMVGALGISVRDQSRFDQTRVAKILRGLGYVRHVLRLGGVNVKCWGKPPTPPSRRCA